MGNSGGALSGGSRRVSVRKRTIGRSQLRARSFIGRETAMADENTALLGHDQDGSAISNNDDYIERLEENVVRLAEKCAALESQNVLVSVQQLDLFARYFSLVLSLTVLYGYWKVTGWVLPSLVEEWLPSLLRHSGAKAEVIGVLAKVSTSEWMMLLLQFSLLLIPYLYNRWTYGSMHRRFQVFVIFFVVLIRIRMCRWREKMFLQDDTSGGVVARYGEACTNDGIWEANYEISARFLYLSILRLRGLWTKTAQYLSSRADFVPVAYIRELSKLQDQAPVTSWEDVQKLLSKSLLQQITDFEQEPLASASIGQVHVAKLGKQKVVVKVQHPHARTLMMDDFRSLKIITRIIGWLEPEYAFMEILMNEWAVEAVKELDFRHEAYHLKEASKALRSWIRDESTTVESNIDGTPFQVEVPQPIDSLSSQKVLVMNFCEGCRIDDFEAIENWKLPRAAVMDGVAQAFAHFMYCSTIFNGDPHAGNLLVRPGVQTNTNKGFTIVILDWGLAKSLPKTKRIAFCQMVYAAATVDYGLLLDSYKTVGLKMKREDAGQSMEDMRFFLRDMAPRDVAKKRIKSKMKQGEQLRAKTQEKVPMESKAYPGEFFFFIRVNELLHGLGSKFGVNVGYLDALRPYAEKGLRMSSHYDIPSRDDDPLDMKSKSQDANLANKLIDLFDDLKKEQSFEGGQICVIQNETTQVDLVAGNLGGLRSHIPMRHDALILGYSTTKAVTTTLAHLMVQEGYISYDEPICERVWKQFCPYLEPPKNLCDSMGLTAEETSRRWAWKRQVTLRHILNHCAGFWSAFPAQLTIKKMASCELCFAGYEFDSNAPEETLLPTTSPSDGEQVYHFMSFGWLVAGTLCGAFAAKHNMKNVTYKEVYEAILEPRLSNETLQSGFRPLGGSGGHVLAQTCTSDIRASKMMQQQRETKMQEETDAPREANKAGEMLKIFQGREFLLDPRVWNSADALDANVPAAGGRFSAAGLANFYQDLASGSILKPSFLNSINATSNVSETSTSIAGLQGVTRVTNDANAGDSSRTQMSMGYQLIQTDRDGNSFSGLGHAGVSGSIGFWHRPSGTCIAVMLNKADATQDVTFRILRVIGNHYGI